MKKQLSVIFVISSELKSKQILKLLFKAITFFGNSSKTITNNIFLNFLKIALMATNKCIALCWKDSNQCDLMSCYRVFKMMYNLRKKCLGPL